ncbi:hypothetical protein [Ekhidna sp.]|uniref:hypothetical protein n=1 Tax=Ekhidna sp. TaxID=2608089 RepID=UPI0032978926
MMDKQLSEQIQTGLLNDFPYRSYHQTLLILNCSKFYLEKLVRNGIVNKYYFEFKNGKGCGKPYFLLSELSRALTKDSDLDQSI